MSISSVTFKQESEDTDVQLNTRLNTIRSTGSRSSEREAENTGAIPVINNNKINQELSSPREAEISAMFAAFELKREKVSRSQELASKSFKNGNSQTNDISDVSRIDNTHLLKVDKSLSEEKEDSGKISSRPADFSLSLEKVMKAVKELADGEQKRHQIIYDKLEEGDSINEKLEELLHNQKKESVDIKYNQVKILKEIEKLQGYYTHNTRDFQNNLETRQKVFEQKVLWDLKYQDCLSNKFINKENPLIYPHRDLKPDTIGSSKDLFKDLLDRFRYAEKFSRENVINLNELYECIKENLKQFTYEDIALVSPELEWGELVHFERLEMFFEWLCVLTECKTIVIYNSGLNSYYCSISIPNRELHFTGTSHSSKEHAYLIACLSALGGNFFRRAIVEILFLHHQVYSNNKRH